MYVKDGETVTPVVTPVVTQPKRDRATYMREYRAKQSHKSGNGELINPEINNIPPPPEINSAATVAVENKPEISEPDEAAQALQKQIAELRKSEELNRQRQEQVNHQQQEQLAYTQWLRQTFRYWRQNGLTAEQEEIFAANPAALGQLTDLVSRQAIEQGHQAGTAEHEQAAKTLFHESLERMKEQAQQRTEPDMPRAESLVTSAKTFFQPLPTPRPNGPAPIVHSAPVSREPRGTGSETDPRRVTLTAEERLLAKNSGVSEIDWARGKLELARRKAAGELQGG
jgi:hypothetical protein